jgi:hypothetical protein
MRGAQHAAPSQAIDTAAAPDGRPTNHHARPTGAPERSHTVPKYVVERTVPGIGKMTWNEMQALSQASCSALNDLGPSIQWQQTYVTDDKLYCVYIAPDPDVILKHARLGSFPADVVSRVRAIVDPTTAE